MPAFRCDACWFGVVGLVGGEDVVVVVVAEFGVVLFFVLVE